MKKHLVIFAVIFCVAAPVWAQGLNNISVFSKHQPFNSGEVIVKFKSVPQNMPAVTTPDPTFGVSELSRSTTPTIKKLFKSSSHKYHPESFGISSTNDKVDEPGVYKLTFPGREDVKDLVDELKKDPNVEYAEPNYLYQASMIAERSRFALQWAMCKIGAPSAWDVMLGTDRGEP